MRHKVPLAHYLRKTCLVTLAMRTSKKAHSLSQELEGSLQHSYPPDISGQRGQLRGAELCSAMHLRCVFPPFIADMSV